MRTLALLLLCLLTTALHAQTSPAIRSLQNKRAELQKQIAQKEKLLGTTQKDVRTQLQTLATLSSQIEERKKYIQGIQADVSLIDQETRILGRQLDSLGRELQGRKDKYARSLQKLYRARSFQEKLMFIFSASSLGEAYRRSRYLRDYAEYQRVLAGSIRNQQEKAEAKRQELQSAHRAKQALLQEALLQQQKLQAQEQEKQALVGKLQQQQKKLQQEISRQRSESKKLNAQIDRLVAIEVEKARKRAEEEARRRRQAEAARRKAEAKKGKSSPRSGKNAPTSSKKSKAEPMESYKMSSEDARLTGTFASNKGRLPMPITGNYLITEHYGRYPVPGTRGVYLDNKGINIQGQAGAQARSIYEGEVASIFNVGGLANIIVRHGTYLSVYCNLSSVSVEVGQKVSTRQILGTVYSDPAEGSRTVLHFQLRKEKTRLNPEQWLAR